MWGVRAGHAIQNIGSFSDLPSEKSGASTKFDSSSHNKLASSKETWAIIRIECPGKIYLSSSSHTVAV